MLSRIPMHIILFLSPDSDGSTLQLSITNCVDGGEPTRRLWEYTTTTAIPVPRSRCNVALFDTRLSRGGCNGFPGFLTRKNDMDSTFGPLYGCNEVFTDTIALQSLFGLGPPNCVNGGAVIEDNTPPFDTPQGIDNEFVLLPNGSIKWIIKRDEGDREFIFYKIGGR